MNSSGVAKSMHFIVDRVVDQARMERMPLSDNDIRKLGFSQIEASQGEMNATADLDAENQMYESRMARLIRAVYDRDVESGKKADWDEALDELADHDVYLVVLLEQAGLLRTQAYFVLPDWRLVWALLPLLAVALLGALLIFSPWGARLVPNASLRLGLGLLLFVAPLVINSLKARLTTRNR